MKEFSVSMNNNLRQHVWDLWSHNRFLLSRYNFNNIFGDDDFSEGVTDEQIKSFLEDVIYEIVPGVKKRTFVLEENTTPVEYVRLKTASFDADGFLRESYSIYKSSDITLVDDVRTVKFRETSPLERAFQRGEKNKKESSYLHLFGDSEISHLIAKFCTAAHSLSISEGNMLEDYIYSDYSGTKFESISALNVRNLVNSRKGETIFFKKIKITGQDFESVGIEFDRQKSLHLDFLLYRDNKLYIRELKDGYDLDTKKSHIELDELEMLLRFFEGFTNLECESKIVLWRLTELIDASIKTKRAKNFVTRGIDWCEFIEVDFQKVNQIRERFNQENTIFALNKMAEILELNKIKV